eukprot:489453_1
MYGSTENRTSGSYVELDEHNDTNVLHKESTKAYVNNYHTLSISEICKIYKVDLEEGLNYDDVALLRRTHGYNKLTLPRRKNSEWIYNSLFSYFFCLITISMILAVIGGILLENIIILSFAGFLCSLIICHFIFVWYYWKHNDEDIEIISRIIANAELCAQDKVIQFRPRDDECMTLSDLYTDFIEIISDDELTDNDDMQSYASYDEYDIAPSYCG